mmetsp:Transcript_64229/g.112075  ORF Transcript_64229/g.112075 Transcript_64229/m.112075 type:complete len:470 (+) Transcript_64229:64-1473(+)
MAPKPCDVPPPEALPGKDHIFAPADEEGFGCYFQEHGFVVIDGVLGDESVSATVDELWECPSLLGGYPMIQRSDPKTWGGDDWPAGSRNFLDSLDPCLERQSWRNRVNPVISRIYEVLYRSVPPDGQEGEQEEIKQEPEESSDGELVVSVDRFGVMRPALVRVTVAGDKGGSPADAAATAPAAAAAKAGYPTCGGQLPVAPAPASLSKEGTEASRTVTVPRPEWRTSRNWLHWDQNPWSTPGFFAMQGLVGLSASSSTSGGFVTVPGFHHKFRQWGQDHPEGSIPKRTAKMVPFPVPLEDEMQSRRVKVIVPPGGLLVWDSRMPHENFPNEGETWRLVQYIMYKRLRPAALEHRAEAWRASIRTGLVPAAFARSFSSEEWARLGMATHAEDALKLEAALQEGEKLSPEALEAARKLRRAYRLKQTAMDPLSLREAKELFQAAFSVNPALKEPLQRVAAAEDTYLPFWIL